MFIAVFLLQEQVSAVEHEKNLKRIYSFYFKRIQDRNFNLLNTKRNLLYLKTQSVPRS